MAAFFNEPTIHHANGSKSEIHISRQSGRRNQDASDKADRAAHDDFPEQINLLIEVSRITRLCLHVHRLISLPGPVDIRSQWKSYGRAT